MENTKQLIYKEDLIAEYDRVHIGPPGGARKLMEDAPTVDAVEVMHGRWEQARYTEAPLYICSKCGKPEYKQHNYCPNCGAKMDGTTDKC